MVPSKICEKGSINSANNLRGLLNWLILLIPRLSCSVLSNISSVIFSHINVPRPNKMHEYTYRSAHHYNQRLCFRITFCIRLIGVEIYRCNSALQWRGDIENCTFHSLSKNNAYNQCKLTSKQFVNYGINICNCLFELNLERTKSGS